MASVAETMKHGLHPPRHSQAVTLGGKAERVGAEACRLNFTGSACHPAGAGRAWHGCLSENQPDGVSSETTSGWVGGVRLCACVEGGGGWRLMGYMLTRMS